MEYKLLISTSLIASLLITHDNIELEHLAHVFYFPEKIEWGQMVLVQKSPHNLEDLRIQIPLEMNRLVVGASGTMYTTLTNNMDL